MHCGNGLVVHLDVAITRDRIVYGAEKLGRKFIALPQNLSPQRSVIPVHEAGKGIDIVDRAWSESHRHNSNLDAAHRFTGADVRSSCPSLTTISPDTITETHTRRRQYGFAVRRPVRHLAGSNHQVGVGAGLHTTLAPDMSQQCHEESPPEPAWHDESPSEVDDPQSTHVPTHHPTEGSCRSGVGQDAPGTRPGGMAAPQLQPEEREALRRMPPQCLPQGTHHQVAEPSDRLMQEVDDGQAARIGRS